MKRSLLTDEKLDGGGPFQFIYSRESPADTGESIRPKPS